MTIIRLKGLSPTNAEKAIARIWYVLEQRGMNRLESRHVEIMAVELIFVSRL